MISKAHHCNYHSSCHVNYELLDCFFLLTVFIYLPINGLILGTYFLKLTESWLIVNPSLGWTYINISQHTSFLIYVPPLTITIIYNICLSKNIMLQNISVLICPYLSQWLQWMSLRSMAWAKVPWVSQLIALGHRITTLYLWAIGSSNPSFYHSYT